MGLLSRALMIFKIKASSGLDSLEDPRQLVDYAYAQQQELLRKTRLGLIEVATSKKRLEYQASKLRSQIPVIEDQATRALDTDREDLARTALERKQTVLAEMEGLDIQVAEVDEEERRLTQTEQELAARIEEFRIRRDTISARYSAAQAQVRVTEALTGVSGEFADLGMALGRAVEKVERMQARASAIGGLIEGGKMALPYHSDPVERVLYEITVQESVENDLEDLKTRLAARRLPAGKKEK